MKLFRRKGKEVVKAKDIYLNEEEAQEFIRRGFERTQKNKYSLYQLGLFENRSKIVSSISQHEISCIDKEVILNLLSKEIVTHLRKSRFSQTHIETILMGITWLTRLQLGIKALAYIYDDRWDNHQHDAIAIDEVDLSLNLAVICCIPNYVTTINEFSKFIKIRIRAKKIGIWKENIKIYVLV